MDYKILVDKYLNYSMWFVKAGNDIHEKETAELNKGIEIEMSKGVSMEEAYNKVYKLIKHTEHPDQEDAWKVDEIIKSEDNEAWLLLKQIIESAKPDEELLNFIGAGPFENWISSGKLAKFKEELFMLIQNSYKWRIVASSSWHNPQELEDFLKQINIDHKGN